MNKELALPLHPKVNWKYLFLLTIIFFSNMTGIVKAQGHVQEKMLIGSWKETGYESVPPKDLEPLLFNYMTEITFYPAGTFESRILLDPHEEFARISGTLKVYGQWEIKERQLLMEIAKSESVQIIPIGKKYADEILE